MKETVIKIAENIYELPKQGKMIVPGKIFASAALFCNVEEICIQQLANVAQLPGIVGSALAMSDVHSGYGFPIGGVAAFDVKRGVVSPGGIGYDIGCGVRLLVSNVDRKDFMRVREKFLDAVYKAVPSGLGERNKAGFTEKDINDVLSRGMRWALEKGYATKEDVEHTEDNGYFSGADPARVSAKARGRGRNQLGTLGSGNHFLEMQEVEQLFDTKKAAVFGITKKGTIAVMIHCGSRGLGHQVASDYIQKMEKEHGIAGLPDRELIYAPLSSSLGKDYFSAMYAAAHFAFVNRQLITHNLRDVFAQFFPRDSLKLVYDIAHNIAKFEEHTVDGKKRRVCVHRKGATRSFGPGRKELPSVYRKTGCPIFLPGSMGTYSYVLAGTKRAEELSFGSTAHGAGRVLSRSYAIKNIPFSHVQKQLRDHDVVLKTASTKGAVEEAPAVYKDIDEVARVSDVLGLGSLVARLKPLAVIKG